MLSFSSYFLPWPIARQADGTTNQGPWSIAAPSLLKAGEQNRGFSLHSETRRLRWSFGIKHKLEELAEEVQDRLRVSISFRGTEVVFRSREFQYQYFLELRPGGAEAAS